MRQVHVAPASASYTWLFDLLFSRSTAVTWAPEGRLPDGFRRIEQFAVLPSGGGRSFMVSLASRRGSAAALTSYNSLRTPRRRLARRVIGLGLRSGLYRPLVGGKIDIGLASAATTEQRAGSLIGEHLADLLGGPVVVAFGGGSGPYRKPVLQVFGIAGTPLGYVKIGWNDWTRNAIRNEAAALRAISAANRRLGVPALLHHGTWNGLELIITEPLPGGVRRHADCLPDPAVLREICDTDGVSELAVSAWWTELRTRISSGLSDEVSRTRLDQLADRIERSDGHATLEFGRWHGDLVPWNLARLGSRLFAWDWESSTARAPVGFDALHFGFQVAFVGRRRPVDEAATIAATGASASLASLGVAAGHRALLSRLHLIELAVRHEEARSATGDSDDRFYPAVLDLLERAAAPTPGDQPVERAA